MVLFILSFLAGALTILAPCILPLLPIIIGGSLVGNDQKKQDKQWLRPLVIAASLAASVVVFTLLLKASTALLGLPTMFWQVVSGVIVLAFGFSMVFPEIWEKMSSKSGLYTSSNRLLGKTFKKNGLFGAMLMGMALGPVFSSCSPTYSLIVATVLPVSFWEGLIYLKAYAIGLASALLIVSYVGQSLVQKLGWLSNPKGWFKRSIGALFIVVGLSVVFGLDKKTQAYVLERGWYDPISNIEKSLRD